MRIVIVVPSLSGGGAEFVAAQWARYLARAGDHATVYATHSKPTDVAPEGVTLVQARQGNAIRHARDLAKLLRQEPVDVVVALMPYWNLIGIAAVRSLGTKRPKVVISGRNLASGLRVVFGGSYGRKQWLARRAYRHADLFIAISHPVGAEAIAQYKLKPDRVTVVPNPALTKVEDDLPSRTDREISSTRLDIVIPARLVPQKRPLVAVEVAAKLRTKFQDGVVLHYFGIGPLHDAIVDCAATNEIDIVMHGWVDKWFDECPIGSVVLLPSLAEGFGNVLIEAAAAGFNSVISSRCMGSADAIIPGITGEVTAGDTVDDYANAVHTASQYSARTDISPWLNRFSFDSSGHIFRDQLVRVVDGTAVVEKEVGLGR